MGNSDTPSVLIVDDNPFNRKVLSMFLQSEGFAVTECRNGKEALERVRGDDYQIIFMDLLMPGMDGFETIETIRNMGIRTPIVIVSSMDAKQDRQRCVTAGADAYLTKPVNLKAMKDLTDDYRKKGFRTEKEASDPPVLKTAGLDPSAYAALLVEEDARLSERFLTFLRSEGFRAEAAANGGAALEMIEAQPYRFQVIITNMFTSGIDGLGVLAKIKRRHPEILVFVYTAAYETDAFQLALQLGADGVFTVESFESSVLDAVCSAVSQSRRKGSRIQAASTASQVRKAQARLFQMGCSEACRFTDIAYVPLTDAGGDLALCRSFNLAGRCGVILGDVAGHDVMSSYISAISLGMLTANWNRNQAPMDLVRRLNAELNKGDYDGYHLCASVLLWDKKRRRIHMCSAGNPGPLTVTVDANGDLAATEFPGGGMCLGLVEEDSLFLSQEVPLADETYFFLFSDGVSRDEILDALRADPDLLRRETISGLSRDILDRILEKRPQTDDIALISLNPGRPAETGGIEYEMPSSFEEIDAVCARFSEEMARRGAPEGKDPDFILLALREALVNAVQHGNLMNPAAFVDISVYFDPDRLRIDVSDQGPGFIFHEKECSMTNVDVKQSGGRGLAVICSVADAVGVNGGTVSLTFEAAAGERPGR